MSDYRNDPELQRLMAAAASIQPKVWKGAWQNNPVNADYKAANEALVNYIDQNRVRLGIPEGHYVNPVTGQVYKPQGTNWFKFGLLYGGMLAGGLGLQAMLGSGAAAASGAGAATTTTAGTVAAAAKTGLGFADLLKAGGSAMGNAAETMAGNRGTRLDAEVTREALDQSRQQQRNANVDAATKNALRADYLARPVAERAATTGFSPYSKPLTNLPNLDPAILDSMRNEAKQTLTNNPGAYQIANDLLQPSGAEKALGYGGAAATIGGAPQSRERRSTDGRVGPLPLSSTL